MSFKENILSKSNSYKHYKNKAEELVKENEDLRKEIKALENRSVIIMVGR